MYSYVYACTWGLNDFCGTVDKSYIRCLTREWGLAVDAVVVEV